MLLIPERVMQPATSNSRKPQLLSVDKRDGNDIPVRTELIPSPIDVDHELVDFVDIRFRYAKATALPESHVYRLPFTPLSEPGPTPYRSF